MLLMLWSRYKRPIVIIALIGSMFLCGYAVGRWGVPSKTLVTEKIVTVEKQVVVTQVKTQVQKVYVASTDKKIHKVTDQVKNKDGSTETRTTEDTNVDTVVHDTQVKYVDRWNERVVEKQVFVDRLKLVEAKKPDWLLSPMVGANLPATFGAKMPGLTIAGPLVLGIEAQRRILGPLYLGIWGTTDGSAGLIGTVQF